MRLHLTAVLSIIIIGYSYLSRAAECYGQSGGSPCVNRDELSRYGPVWCGANYNVLNGDWWLYKDSRGNTAWIGKIGSFANTEQCSIAYDNILGTCYGKKNGGSWTASKVVLSISFCAWPPVFGFDSFRVEDGFLKH
jgi:alpha-galactosyl binding lectin